MKKERSHSLGGMREMIALALPMVVSHGCETMMTFTDRMFLARLGPDMMNAAMAGGLTAFMMMTFFLGLLDIPRPLSRSISGRGKKINAP
jgi:MATE family multidrug resistance protein